MNILKLLNKENLNFLDIENFIEENYNGSYERFINDEFNEYPIGETIKKIVPTISNADIFVNTLFIAIDQKNKILLDYIYNKGLLEESNKRPSSILKKKMITIKYAAAIQVISLFEVLEKIIINDSENNKIVFKILDKYCKEKINDKFYLSNKMISYFMNNGYYNLLNIFKDLLLTQKNERSTLNKISKIINDNNFENFLTLITTNLVAPNKNYYEILIHNIIMTSAKKDNNSTLIIVRLLSEHFAKNYNIFFGEYLSLSKDSESKNDVKRYLNEKISPFIAAIYKDNVEVIKYFLNNGYLLSEDEKILLSTFNEKSINEIIPDFNSQGQEEEYQKFIRILVCGESENNLSFVEKSLSEQFMFESFKFIEENYKEGYEDILSKKESNTQIFIIFKNYLISEEKKLLDKQMYNINEKPNKKRL